MVRELKEKYCHVPLQFTQQELDKEVDSVYTLPDHTTVTLGQERVFCPEAMFRPSLLGSELSGVHQCVFSSITSCGIDIRKTLFNNILLSGGNTMFPGFAERLKREVSSLIPYGTSCEVNAPADRDVSVWKGGSVLASLDSFRESWITAEEYEEYGPSIIHIKCPA